MLNKNDLVKINKNIPIISIFVNILKIKMIKSDIFTFSV